jgi:hypothetical protein
MGLGGPGERLSLLVALLLVPASAWSSSIVLPLTRRDGGLLARGLLRNATLPLHGAVKDYGCASGTWRGNPASQWCLAALAEPLSCTRRR